MTSLLGINMTMKDRRYTWADIGRGGNWRYRYPQSVHDAEDAARVAWDEADAINEEYMMTGRRDLLPTIQAAQEAAHLADEAVARMKREYDHGR